MHENLTPRRIAGKSFHLPCLVFSLLLCLISNILAEELPAGANPNKVKQVDPFAEAGLDGGLGSTGTFKKPPPPYKLSWYVGFAFNGTPLMDNSWAPLHLELTNNTEETLTGKLCCLVEDTRPFAREAYKVTYSRDVSIPGRKTRKHFDLPIYLPTISSMKDSTSIEAWLEIEGRGRMRADGGVPITMVDRNATVINQGQGKELAESRSVRNSLALVLGSGSYDVLRGTSSSNRDRKVAVGSLESLPRHWSGYSGLEAVVWSGADLAALDPMARQALQDYVSAGGHLICAVGSDVAALRNSQLDSLIPFDISGISETDIGGDILGLGNRPPAKIASGTPRLGGRLLDLGNGKASAIRRDFGAGSITFCPFSMNDPALQVRASAGQIPRQKRLQLMDTLLKQGAAPLELLANEPFRKNGAAFLNETARKRIPSRALIVSFLTIYVLALSPLMYFLFRGLRRPEWAWLITPLLAVGAFVFVWQAAFFNQSGALSINDLTAVVSRGGESRGLALALTRYWSPGLRHDICWSNASATPSQLRLTEPLQERTSDRNFELDIPYANDKLTLHRLYIGYNELRIQEVSAVAELGRGIEVTGLLADKLNKGEICGEACNRTGLPMRNCALLWRNGKGNFLGAVLEPLPQSQPQPLLLRRVQVTGKADGKNNAAAGTLATTGEVDITGKVRKGWSAIDELCQVSGGKAMAALRDSVLAALQSAASNHDGPIFLGFSPGNLSDSIVDGARANANSLTIFIILLRADSPLPLLGTVADSAPTAQK